MTEKGKRRLKIILLVSGILLFAGYMALRTFLFDPFEGDFGSIPAVVPRNVDFFLRKKKLRDDFTTFPEPKFFADLSRGVGWDRLLKSDIYADLEREFGIQRQLDDLQKNLAQMPIDIVKDAIGRELIVAGKAPEGGGAIRDFAIYARVSWKVKLGLGFCRYPGLVKSFASHIEIQQEADDILKIRGAAPQDLYLWQDRDLVVISTSMMFPKKAQELLAGSGEDSLGLSAKYQDSIQRFLTGGNEIEFLLDLEKQLKQKWGPGNWPVLSWGLPGRIAAEFVKPESIRQALAIAKFGERVDLKAHLNLDADLLSDFQRRLYEANSLTLAQDIQEKAKMVPKRSFLFGALACDPGEFLRAAERGLDDNQRRLVNDQFRVAGTYRDLRQLVDDIAPSLKRNIYVMCQRNDYPRMSDDPPNDGSPDPLWAFVFTMKNREKAAEIVEYFKKNYRSFGVENLFQFPAGGGYNATEFFSQLIPATGELTVLPMGELFFFSNSPKYLKEILRCNFNAAPDSRLVDEPGFSDALADFETSPNVFLYFNSRRWEEVFRDQIPILAQQMLRLDYAGERVRARDRVIVEKYPNYRGRSLPPDIARDVERLVDEEINKFEIQARGPALQKNRESLEDLGLWITSFPFVHFALRTDKKAFDLFLRAAVDWR